MLPRRIARRFALILACSAMPLAHADGSPWYLGVDAGLSRYSLDLSSPYSTNTPGASEDRNAIAYAVSGGYRFNRYVALEAGYMDLGKYKLRYQDSTKNGHASATVDGLAASALWQLPLNEQWGVFLKTGLLLAHGKAKADVTTSGSTEHFSRSESATVPLLGIGVSYAPTPQWAVRLQYQDVGGTRVAGAAGYKADLHDDLWTVGLTYSF